MTELNRWPNSWGLVNVRPHGGREIIRAPRPCPRKDAPGDQLRNAPF